MALAPPPPCRPDVAGCGAGFWGDGCTAFAITMGGNEGAASCGTFVALDARGGMPNADSQVGACQRLECKYNNDLMCSAEAITVGGDSAACELYEVA